MDQRWKAGGLTYHKISQSCKKTEQDLIQQISQQKSLFCGPHSCMPFTGEKAVNILIGPILPSQPPYLPVTKATVSPGVDADTAPRENTEEQ